MTLSTTELLALAAVANDAARAAGELVAKRRPQSISHKRGASSLASAVVTEVDRASEAAIVERLAPTLARHDLALLTEERPDDGARHERPYFWCVDPIDGTLPFVEGVPGYAVSIALVSRNGVAQLGSVFDPVRGSLRHAIRGHGIFVDGQPWSPPPPDPERPLSLFTDRSFAGWVHRDRLVAALREIAVQLGRPGVSIEASAGAVLNACRVLDHDAACSVKFPKPQAGGGSVWDYAATACLFAEAGAHASDIHGAPLDLNPRTTTYMNRDGVVFASDDDLARRICALPTMT